MRGAFALIFFFLIGTSIFFAFLKLILIVNSYILELFAFLLDITVWERGRIWTFYQNMAENLTVVSAFAC